MKKCLDDNFQIYFISCIYIDQNLCLTQKQAVDYLIFVFKIMLQQYATIIVNEQPYNQPQDQGYETIQIVQNDNIQFTNIIDKLQLIENPEELGNRLELTLNLSKFVDKQQHQYNIQKTILQQHLNLEQKFKPPIQQIDQKIIVQLLEDRIQYFEWGLQIKKQFNLSWSTFFSFTHLYDWLQKKVKGGFLKPESDLVVLSLLFLISKYWDTVPLQISNIIHQSKHEYKINQYQKTQLTIFQLLNYNLSRPNCYSFITLFWRLFITQKIKKPNELIEISTTLLIFCSYDYICITQYSQSEIAISCATLSLKLIYQDPLIYQSTLQQLLDEAFPLLNKDNYNSCMNHIREIIKINLNNNQILKITKVEIQDSINQLQDLQKQSKLD